MRDSSGRFTKKQIERARTVREDVADCYWMLREIQKDLRALRGEAGEHWRQIEGDVERMQKVIGILANHSQVKVPVVDEPMVCRWSLVGHAGDPCPKCGAGPCPILAKERAVRMLDGWLDEVNGSKA
jgi:hypothetical protein